MREEQLEVCRMLHRHDGVVISKGRLELEREAIQRGHLLPKVGMTVTDRPAVREPSRNGREKSQIKMSISNLYRFASPDA